MDLKEVLVAAGKLGAFPTVVCQSTVKYATSSRGVITEINTRGVAVQFPGVKWNTWFSWEPGTDKRSHYASDLTLVNP